MADKVQDLAARVVELATGQHGLVTAEQLLRLGASRDVIARWARGGWLRRVHRGVYVVGPFLSLRGRWLAAVLALGEGAVLSHRPAAALWGIRECHSRLVDVTTTKPGGRSRQGIIVHASPSLPRSEHTTHDRIPVTTPARTLLDLASVLTGRALERAIDEAARLDLCGEEHLVEIAQAHPTRKGTRLLKQVLGTHKIGSTATRKGLEEAFLRLCDRHHLPRPEVNMPIDPFIADFLWRDRELIVETDDRQSHATRKAFEGDRARDAELATRGYRTIRFTHRQVTDGEAYVVRVLKALLLDQ